MGKSIRIFPCSDGLICGIAREARAENSGDQRRSRPAQRPGHKPRHPNEPAKQSGVAEARVAREKLVAAKPGERHLETDFARGPGDKGGVDAVHRRLVEAGQRFIDAREHRRTIERHFRMLRAASFRDFAR